MGSRLAVVTLVLVALAGCVTPDITANLASTDDRVPLLEADYVTVDDVPDLKWSRTLAPGTLGRLPVEVVDVESFDGTLINVGIFRPDTAERVPVIVDAGPYYDEGDAPADSAETQRLGGFLIENFVPHGYAVAQVSVRGTGASTGCSDMMGAKESRDLDLVVTWLGEQEWSSGAVAMIGRSYDGSTPFEAAQFGNPHLKTIVPISGIPSLRELYYRNGSAEFRAPVLGAAYWWYGAGGNEGGVPLFATPRAEPASARVACPDGPLHVAWGTEGVASGGAVPALGEHAYWSERDYRPEIEENYEGSIFLVHGLQDWNVHPDVTLPWVDALDVETKMWLGQWAHMYPDRPSEHTHLRWDWAETLLRWFDRELKGLDVDVGPAVEVEDSTNRWRAEASWPPADAAWTPYHPTPEGALASEPGAAATSPLYAPAPLPRGALATAAAASPLPSMLTWETEPLPADTLVAGLPQLHVTVVPTTPGGHLYARLYDVPPEGDPVQIGRAQMDLRYAAGGTEPQAVVPGQHLLARMEFAPLDARVLAGHTIRLELTQEVFLQPLPSPLTGPVEVVMGESTVLRLPLLDREVVPSRWDNPDAELVEGGF